MKMLIVGGSGRFVRPKRLAESGYQFQFTGSHEAFIDLFS
ncbi:MAG: DUF1731 domain-containing protein [Anaerolineales bacterium]|nr:DUF1731 domain-containing protein [Anaerolineales bacterium]